MPVFRQDMMGKSVTKLALGPWAGHMAAVATSEGLFALNVNPAQAPAGGRISHIADGSFIDVKWDVVVGDRIYAARARPAVWTRKHADSSAPFRRRLSLCAHSLTHSTLPWSPRADFASPRARLSLLFAERSPDGATSRLDMFSWPL